MQISAYQVPPAVAFATFPLPMQKEIKGQVTDGYEHGSAVRLSMEPK